MSGKGACRSHDASPYLRRTAWPGRGAWPGPAARPARPAVTGARGWGGPTHVTCTQAGTRVRPFAAGGFEGAPSRVRGGTGCGAVGSAWGRRRAGEQGEQGEHGQWAGAGGADREDAVGDQRGTTWARYAVARSMLAGGRQEGARSAPAPSRDTLAERQTTGRWDGRLRATPGALARASRRSGETVATGTFRRIGTCRSRAGRGAVRPGTVRRPVRPVP